MNFAIIWETERTAALTGELVDGLQSEYIYHGPQFYLQTVAEISAAQGEILPIPAPFLNSSWTLDFNGQALRCEIVSDTLYEEITSNIQDVMESESCLNYYRYLSWIPGANSNGSRPLSFFGNGTSSFQSSGPAATVLLPTFFMATFPGTYSVNVYRRWLQQHKSCLCQ